MLSLDFLCYALLAGVDIYSTLPDRWAQVVDPVVGALTGVSVRMHSPHDSPAGPTCGEASSYGVRDVFAMHVRERT